MGIDVVRREAEAKYSSRVEEYFEAVEEKLQFCRTGCGLQECEGEFPGAVVVIGQSRRADSMSGRPVYHVLATHEDEDLSGLLRKTLGFVRRYFLERVYGNPESHVRDHMQRTRTRFPLVEAAYLDDFPYAARQVKSLIKTGVLRFVDRDLALKKELQRFAPEHLKDVRKSEFPLLAALAHAVMSLEVHKHHPHEDRMAAAAAEAYYADFEP